LGWDRFFAVFVVWNGGVFAARILFRHGTWDNHFISNVWDVWDVWDEEVKFTMELRRQI